jgi:dihydrofolate reductase
VSESRGFRCPWMGSERAQSKVFRIPWENAGGSSTVGSSERRRSRPCSAKAVARKAWTRALPTARWTASVLSSLAGTCSVLCAANGRTTVGRGGGRTIRPIMPPTFVLTHHARKPIVMEGGTTSHFVTDGIHAALERAREAAGARDVKIGGGVSTVRQYLKAGLIDELLYSFSPVLLGRGEGMFEGLDLPVLGYRVEKLLRQTSRRMSCSGVRRRNERPRLKASPVACLSSLGL